MDLAWRLMFLYNILIANAAGNTCPRGFTGQNCKKQNIALHKPTYQTDTYGYHVSGLAVDGISGFSLLKDNCTHTNNTTNASWSVKLNDSMEYNITHYTLYLRDILIERYRNLRVLVDGTICEHINITNGTKGGPAPNPVNGQCIQTLRGNNVSVHVDNAYLTLCEVQIWVCSDGWFGVDCGNACKCQNTSEICDKETGYCRSGCARGWHGVGCQIECPDGFFGNCSQRCNCQNSTEICSKTTGTCPDSGCKNGTYEPDCQTVCRNKTYGFNCTSSCGHCKNSVNCDPGTGVCRAGCEAGWRTEKCDKVCSDGWFGVDCGIACKCLNSSEICDKETGYCRSGCARGWHGDGCQTECIDGMFGSDCTIECGSCKMGDQCDRVSGRCNGECKPGFMQPLCKECAVGFYGDCSSTCGHCGNDDNCDSVTGKCPNGCEHGYVFPLCQECAVGFYGDCSSKCGHCSDNASCDNVTGWCPNGCQDGYISPLCQGIVRDGPEKTSSPVGAIVGGGVVAVLAVIAIALGIFFLRRKYRRARNKSTHEDTQLEDIYERINDDTANIYDTLRIYFNDDNTYTHISSVSNLKQFIKDKLATDGIENELHMQQCDDKSKTVEESGNNQPNNVESSCKENSPGTDSTRNAVSGCSEGELYTIAKDPTHLTVNEFWKMIWQRNVTKIVMLTHSTEMTQSVQYWPKENGGITMGGININSSSETTRANFTIRDFLIQEKASQSPRRTVTQFHFSTWPEHSFPPIPSLLTFLKKVTKRTRGSEDDGPILVHCRSKGGRTGVFIALHSLMTQVKNDDTNAVQSVANFLQTRSDLLESEDQFQFVYETLLEALESRGTFYTQLKFDEKYGRDLTYTVEQEDEMRVQFQALSGLKKELSQEVLSEALLSENINKNRCQDILPAIRTRPYLPNPVTGMNDYINAVVLTSYTRPASFLVTQTPLEETVEDFWRLVYHHNCNTIVCLDDNQDALSLYPRQNTSTGVGVFQIEAVMKDRSRDSFTELHLSLSLKEQNNPRRDIRVFLTPISNTSFSQESSSTFLSIVQHLEDNSIQGDRKILVHCLDGSCMSGVFCSVMNIVSRLRLDKEVDIFLAIRELQIVRPQFVLTYAQYKLCYDVVKEYHRHSNTYINVGVTSDTDME